LKHFSPYSDFVVTLPEKKQYSLYMHSCTHPFNGPFSVTIRVSLYQKGKTNLDFAEARDSEWQWHPLGHMQVCTLLLSDNHASLTEYHIIST